ncbi:MAG: Uncharacterised protein [Euryarchaeota archaeon UBA443]|nr:MAG: Uncharacterised protein [Euryarchaeota archaeon UBA443]
MLLIWSFSTNTRSVEVKMPFEPFENKFVVTEICSMLLMRNYLSWQPLQANSQIQVSMSCGRSSQPWSDLRLERRWKSSVNVRESFHQNVFTISPILLQPFEPTTRKTQPLLRNSVFASTLNLQRNTFLPSLRMLMSKSQNFWKKLKRLVKISQTIEP